MSDPDWMPGQPQPRGPVPPEPPGVFHEDMHTYRPTPGDIRKESVVQQFILLLQLCALAALIVLAVVAGHYVVKFARAEPPAGAATSGPISDWFKSLKQPGTEMSCCDVSDCRPVRYRAVKDGFDVYIAKSEFPHGTDAWEHVPASKVLRQRENPVGEGVACWMPMYGVMCFVEGPAG